MAETKNRAYAARAKAGQITEAKAQELSEKDIEKARTQFEGIYEATHQLRARIKADHEYADGVHPDGDSMRWTVKEKSDRGTRPSLSIDAMGGPIAQVVNGIAESKPATDMLPIGGGADDDKAEVWEGLLRRIQTTPEAEYAGAWAGEHLVKLGMGAWVVTARYPEYNGDPQDPANWEMELSREWIENQHGVWAGPATKPDGSDRQVAFILQPLTEEQFDDRFGEGEYKQNRDALEQLTKSTSLTAWSNTNTITVATWYRVKAESVTIRGQAADGSAVSRTVSQRRVCVSTITATKEYEYSELPIPYIPVVIGYAKRSNIDGQVDVKGMVRTMKHAQDLLNYWASEIPSMVAMSSRQEVVAAIGQIENQPAGMWDLNRRPNGPRTYDPVPIDGVLAPPPIWQNMEAPIQAMTLALQQAEGFVRKTAGFYDADSDQTRASLSKESGIARRVRQEQGEMGTSDFARAYAFMLFFETKILMAWARHVYTAARVQRITGRDEGDKVAVTYFGQDFAQDAEARASQVPSQGHKPTAVHDLSVGRYDIKPRITKNPLTQRREDDEALTEIIQIMPPEMAARVIPVWLEQREGTVMRRVAAALNPKDQQTVSIEDAQKAQQVIDELSSTVQELKRQIDTKAEQAQSAERIALAEIDSKERIEAAKLDLERVKMLHETKMKEYEMVIAKAQAEFDAHQADLDREHESSEAEAGHERGIEASEHAAATEYALREPEQPEATV